MLVSVQDVSDREKGSVMKQQVRIPRGLLAAWVVAMSCAALTASADTIMTNDGSAIEGTIKTLSGGKLIIATSFAGDITIDQKLIKGIVLSDEKNVEFASGDQLLGKIEKSGDALVMKSGLGDIPVDVKDMTLIWSKDAQHPKLVAARPKWKVSLEGGAQQTEGNNETLSAHGALNAERKTKDDLLNFYLMADYFEDDGVRSRNEYRGGVLFEGNITSRLYWYTRMELEHDEFEDLNIRATAGVGGGYYWIKKDKHEFKTRAGIGYRHESYDDSGIEQDSATLDLGANYFVEILPWLQFYHATSYSPDIEEFENYRIDFDTYVLVPLAATADQWDMGEGRSIDSRWKLKLGMRNEYNSQPPPGVEELDNTYYANILLELR